MLWGQVCCRCFWRSFKPADGSYHSNMLWLFTYRFTIMPILLLLPVFVLLGVLVPLIIYRFAAKATIVERLRETES